MESEQPWPGRRVVGWLVVAALCVAALAAISAILSGGFDAADARVIAVSVGFGLFSGTGGSGATLVARQPDRWGTLGLGTIVLSILSFVLLVAAVWGGGSGDVWRWTVSIAVATLASSHACLMTTGARADDSPAVTNVRATSIVLATVAAFLGILAASGAVEHPGDGFYQFLAVVVILLLLATTLVPILRRLESGEPRAIAAPAVARAAADRPVPPAAPQSLATEVMATADRIEALIADAGTAAEPIKNECNRLRELARLYSR